jgi:hypothetical protein
LNIDGERYMSNPDISTRINGNRTTGLLRRACLVAVAVSALTAASALAGPSLKTVEECLESGTDLVALPAVPGGMLTAKECSACDSQRLTFDANTRYFIGKQAVPYARLRTAAAKGNLRLDIFYRPDTRVLTRVRLVASADANKQ